MNSTNSFQEKWSNVQPESCQKLVDYNQEHLVENLHHILLLLILFTVSDIFVTLK